MPLLNPNTLTRHAVCLGATGSGKTGLCTGILEDLALAGIPLLIIDLKGDMSNMALVFRDLAADSFAPWTTGQDPADVAQAWTEGLAKAGMGTADAQRWHDTVDLQLFTPGSDAATPVDVLSALTRAPAGLNSEGITDYATGAVSALLGLIGREANPHTDPASILLCRLLGDAFAAGRTMPIDQLIPAVVDPPFLQVGYFGTDTFMERDDRLKLAKELNAVMASPAFAAWRRGVPLDVGAWLTPGKDGKTPVRIVYLAHLDDAQRMFFVTLLMHAVVGWSRRLPGSSDLRALVYMDEVAGYLPPYPKNPPSKSPILTLMKQARGVGVGVLLATQNPVDLDYKAMSNAGTWLVGRLRTKQDRARVLDGLSSVGVDPEAIGDDLATLAQRSFLVIDGKVTAVTSRQTLSYLRGPLTRAEVARLGMSSFAAAAADDGLLPAPPPLPEGLTARWLRPEGLGALGLPVVDLATDLVWRPAVYGRLSLRFDEREFVEERLLHRLVRHEGGADSLDGGPPSASVALSDAVLARACPVTTPARYAPLPPWLHARDAVDALVASWRASALAEPGPDEAPSAESDDVRLVGVALVWVPHPSSPMNPS